MVHGVGLVLCGSILVLTVSEKFLAGGWVTLVITLAAGYAGPDAGVRRERSR